MVYFFFKQCKEKYGKNLRGEKDCEINCQKIRINTKLPLLTAFILSGMDFTNLKQYIKSDKKIVIWNKYNSKSILMSMLSTTSYM